MRERLAGVRSNPAELVALGVAAALIAATAVTAGNRMSAPDDAGATQLAALHGEDLAGAYVSGRSSARAALAEPDGADVRRADAPTSPPPLAADPSVPALSPWITDTAAEAAASTQRRGAEGVAAPAGTTPGHPTGSTASSGPGAGTTTSPTTGSTPSPSAPPTTSTPSAPPTTSTPSAPPTTSTPSAPPSVSSPDTSPPPPSGGGDGDTVPKDGTTTSTTSTTGTSAPAPTAPTPAPTASPTGQAPLGSGSD
ncbi:hypothetical protein [Thalassiella azotivora]